MKRKSFFLLFTLGLLASACTYHGTIRPNLYPSSTNENPVEASIFVLADHHIPQEIYITDPDDSDTQAYLLHTSQGVVVSVTDALGTLFTQADAGADSFQEGYDFVADVTMETGLTRNNCEGNLAKYAVRQEGLCTELTISIRRSGQTTPVAVAKASRWREFRKPGFASSVRWVNKHTYIFSPILTPLYVQSQGSSLRKQLESNLTEALQDILYQLRENRERFVKSLKEN